MNFIAMSDNPDYKYDDVFLKLVIVFFHSRLFLQTGSHFLISGFLAKSEKTVLWASMNNVSLSEPQNLILDATPLALSIIL